MCFSITDNDAQDHILSRNPVHDSHLVMKELTLGIEEFQARFRASHGGRSEGVAGTQA